MKDQNFWRSIFAVVWAFFGVRKSEEYEKDIEKIKPIHAIIVGVVLTAIFVISLIILVNIVIAV